MMLTESVASKTGGQLNITTGNGSCRLQIQTYSSFQQPEFSVEELEKIVNILQYHLEAMRRENPR